MPVDKSEETDGDNCIEYGGIFVFNGFSQGLSAVQGEQLSCALPCKSADW